MISDIVQPIVTPIVTDIVSPVSRFYMTYDGSTSFGTLTTPITFAGDFEIDVDIELHALTGSYAIVSDNLATANSYIRIDALNGSIDFFVDGFFFSNDGAFTADSKFNNVNIKRTGSSMVAKWNGATVHTATVGTENFVIAAAARRGDGIPNYLPGVIANLRINNAGTPTTFPMHQATSSTELSNEGNNTITFTAVTKRTFMTKQVNGDWLAAQIAVNSAFNSDTVWTKGTGWSIGSGVASSDGTQVADSDLTQSILDSGARYQTKQNIKSVSAGNLTAIAGTAEGTDRSTIGIFTENITANGALAGVRADLNFVGDADDVEFREILEAP